MVNRKTDRNVLLITARALSNFSFLLIMAVGSSPSASAQEAHGPREPIINGVAYSSLYPSADFASRVNECISDAAAGVAASHVCNSSAESPRQDITHQIDIGTKAGAAVTWVHSANCSWHVRIKDATAYALYQYPGTRVYGANQQRNGCEITNDSPDDALAGLYINDRSGYYQFGDFTFRESGGRLTGRGVVVIHGAYDNSYYHDVTILNYAANTTGLFIGGASPCCSLMFERLSIGANDTGGTLVDIEGGGANEMPGIWFYNSSFGHPARGKPILVCHDAGMPYLTSIGFFGVYEEITGPLGLVPLNQIDGCVSAFFHGITIEAVRAPASAAVAAWSVTSAFPTALDITNLNMGHGFPLPHRVLIQAHDDTVFTDAAGNLASYTNGIAYAAGIRLPPKTPSPNDRCTPGTILGTDANYIYICVASGTVKRSALSPY